MEMPDAMTQLAKEFLELNHYIVSTNIKIPKSKNQTESDVDIIASSNKGSKTLADEFDLKYKTIIGEVKNYSISSGKTLTEVYYSKFKHVEENPFSRNRIKEYVRLSHKFDKVLFCKDIKPSVLKYAKKHKIKIITAVQMISYMARHYKGLITNNAKRSHTYYPEWYNYNTLRILMDALADPSYYRDRLHLKDLVLLDFDTQGSTRSGFIHQNQSFLEGFSYHAKQDVILKNLITRLYENYPRAIIDILKSNNKLWNDLIKRTRKKDKGQA